MNLDKTDLRTACQTLIQNTSGHLAWQWDARFKMALISFAVSDAGLVEGWLAPVFAQIWDVDSLQVAPDLVHRLAHRLDLREGQRIYATNTALRPVLYGAWWPWNNGRTISLRIGATDDSLAPDDADRLTAELKLAFGL